MLLAVISDTHDNLFRLEKAIEEINKKNIKTVFHCGDIGLKTVDRLKQEKFIVYMVCGNGDYFPEIKSMINNSNIRLFEDAGEAEIDGKNIAITHQIDLARLLAKTGKYNIIFHGHSHKRSEETLDKTLIINPGDIEGRYKNPSFLIYDTILDKFEFINI